MGVIRFTRRSWLAGCAAAPWARLGTGRPDEALLVAEPPFVARAEPESVRIEVWSRQAHAGRAWEQLRFAALERRSSVAPGRGAGWAIRGLPLGPLHVRIVARRRARWTCASADVVDDRRRDPVAPNVRPGGTRVEHVVRRVGGGRVDSERALLAAPPVDCTLHSAGSEAPPFELPLDLGASARVDGVRAERVTRRRVPGPEAADPRRWAIRPGASRAERDGRDEDPRFRFVDEVAPVRALRLRVRGVPDGARQLVVHARSVAGWRTAPVHVEPPATTVTVPVVHEGEVDLLARALGPGRAGEDAPLALGLVRIEGTAARAAVELQDATSALILVPGGRVGEALRVRLEGWTLDLAAAPLGRRRRVELSGLLPGARHDVLGAERRAAFVAPGPGRRARWTLR